MTGRREERRLLLLAAPLVALAAWGVAASRDDPAAVFAECLVALGSVWAACLLLHLLLAAARFDGDEFVLPILALILLIACAYHLRPSDGQWLPTGHVHSSLLALAIIGAITLGGGLMRRVTLLIEERVWWRLAGDRLYYESLPFHLVLLVLMLCLAVLLVLKGVRAENGALIQVELPGGFRFTPSEPIRLAVAFFLADYLGRHSRAMSGLRQPLGQVWPFNRIHLEQRKDLGALLLMAGLYCVFFYPFRDFGPAAVVISLTLCALFAATGRWLTPLLIGLAVALAIAVPTWHDVAFHTLRNRVQMWIFPWDTHFVNGDHQARILWAIAAGGWFGMGVGEGRLERALPLAHNDAAFAGVAAEMGMWTALVLLGLFAALTWRGLLAARAAPTDRLRLLACCLSLLLGIQALWICGAMVRVFPFTGINLPFVSTGLSSMLCSAVALGAVWSISRSQGVVLDVTTATPEVLAGVSRLARPAVLAFAAPAVGVAFYGCPLLLGDRTLERQALGVGRDGERTAFASPHLVSFRRAFPRGRVFSGDGQLLAVSNPDDTELAAIREVTPSLANQAREDRRLRRSRRYYPHRAETAHLVGWTSNGDFAAGRGSVETAWDSYLRGYRPDQLLFYYRNRNNPLVRRPEPSDLQLTVDARLQERAHDRLAQAVRSWGGRGGAVVAFDAITGEVLVAATAPSFDPNLLTADRLRDYQRQNARTGILVNKALDLQALFFPGSAFKLLTAASALERGVGGSVQCRNGRNATPISWDVSGRTRTRRVGRVHDYSRGGHGMLRLDDDLDRAMAVSCNVYFAALAAAVGPDGFHQTLRLAEVPGMPGRNELDDYLPEAGFGQVVVKSSPLHMAMVAAAAAVAGAEGTEIPAARPHWVRAIVSRGDRRREEGPYGAPQDAPFRPFSQRTARRLRELMTHAVNDPSGTAYAAFHAGGLPRLPWLEIGGKTGTAEFEERVRESDGGRRRRRGRHAWFVGFARSEAEVQPRTIAIAVLIEAVRPGGTGGSVCAPLARDLLAELLPPPGPSLESPPGGLERYYQERVRPRLGPFGPIIDWIRERLNG